MVIQQDRDMQKKSLNVLILVTNEIIILKEVRLNIAIDFIQNNFSENKIIYVVRNPYDVVESQINSSRFWNVKKIPYFYRKIVKNNFGDFPTESPRHWLSYMPLIGVLSIMC